MAEWTAYIGNYSCSKSKEWRPCGRRDPGHQDITLSHLIELVGTVNDLCLARDTPRAGSDSLDHITDGLVSAGWHHPAPVYPQEAGPTFEWQGRWWRDGAFTLPGRTPLGHDCMIVC
jgi:hypothetical protein